MPEENLYLAVDKLYFAVVLAVVLVLVVGTVKLVGSAQRANENIVFSSVGHALL